MSQNFNPDGRHGSKSAWRRAVLALLTLFLFLPALAACSSGERSSSDRDTKAREDMPLTQPQISAVQTTLTKLGYDPGPVDGLMGPKTSRAIAAYQQKSGLKITGLATYGLLEHMKAQPDTAPQVVAVEAAIPEGLYPVGTHFVYNGDEVHTVKAIKGNRVYWNTSLGDSYVTGAHFGLPHMEWRSGSWKGTSESTLPPETSWPPARGMNFYFDVTTQEWNEKAGKDAHRYVSDSSWSCRNTGSKTTKVPAGSFKAQAILCERSPAPAGDWQKRVWYYVPAVGHYVRRSDFDGAGMEVGEMELVAIQPGGGNATFKKGLDGAIDDALDRVRPGQTAVWKNPRGSEIYLIKVGEQFEGPGGKPCRTYKIAKRNSEPAREYPALACKSGGKGRWVIPGLK